jgi:hypothetical protein
MECPQALIARILIRPVKRADAGDDLNCHEAYASRNKSTLV